MNFIKAILAKYKLLVGILLPWGPWGVLAIAALDSAALGMPLDLIVAQFVYADRARFLLYCVLGAVGGALGSLVVYAIGYEGGEALLLKRMGKERFAKIHASFENHQFLALMLPAMLPPPTPFKLFVLAAGVAEMSIWRFLLAIFLGRMVRFLILSGLTIYFGPNIVDFVMHGHMGAKLIVLGCVAVAVFLWWRFHRSKSPATAEPRPELAEQK